MTCLHPLRPAPIASDANVGRGRFASIILVRRRANSAMTSLDLPRPRYPHSIANHITNNQQPENSPAVN